MSLLKAEPPAPVRSLTELFAIAQTLETEAATQYAELARKMRALGLPDVAAVFEHLVAEEAHHAEAIERWSREVTGSAPDPKWLRWRPAESLDEEEARSIASSQLASAYRALSMAVRNEERAFLLWTYIAAQAEDVTIREAAETIAKEELRHAAIFRRERRRAFHAARAGQAHVPQPEPASAARIERELAAHLLALAETPTLVEWATELRRLAAEAMATAAEAETEAASPGTLEAPMSGKPSFKAARQLAERAADLYLAAADTAGTEDALLRLQSRADRAIARIARLGAMEAGN
jgi:rubrerythrin